MNIRVISSTEYDSIADSQFAKVSDKIKYNFDEWTIRRDALIKHLGKIAKPDISGTGSGDFFVGDDWFGQGYLPVAILKWSAYKKPIIAECQRFVVSQHRDYVITVGKAIKSPEDVDINVALSVAETCLSVYKLDRTGAWDWIHKDKRLAPLRNMIS